MKLTQVKAARRHYPLAPRKQATRQAIRLVLAQEYLMRRDISAIATGSKFQYARSTGSVL
jgi:hypothetical protein